MLKANKASAFRHRIYSAESVASKWKVLNTALKVGSASSTHHSSIPSDVHARAFKDIVDNVVSTVSRGNDNACLEYVEPVDGSRFDWPEDSSSDVNVAIGRLKNKASNYSGIAGEAVKDCADSLASTLAKLISPCLQNGVYPSCLKVSRVTAIFKGGYSSDPSNYRHVSIIPILAKIFESVIRGYISKYFPAHTLYSDTQHGFIANRSTVTACAGIMDYVHRTVDAKYNVGMVLLDLTKAFDTIDHRILLKKTYILRFRQQCSKVVRILP
jgi:hypothetical protein